MEGDSRQDHRRSSTPAGEGGAPAVVAETTSQCGIPSSILHARDRAARRRHCSRAGAGAPTGASWVGTPADAGDGGVRHVRWRGQRLRRRASLPNFLSSANLLQPELELGLGL
jgi:hypothetical protein